MLEMIICLHINSCLTKIKKGIIELHAEDRGTAAWQSIFL